jgi:hypothetical protein
MAERWPATSFTQIFSAIDNPAKEDIIILWVSA